MKNLVHSLLRWCQLFLVCLLASGVLSKYSLDAHENQKSCLDLLEECKQNSSCKTAYKIVKKKCKSNANVCAVTGNAMQRCVKNINVVKSDVFGETCSCKPIKGPNKLRKITDCLEVRNSLYGNPCYDLGMRANRKKKPPPIIFSSAATSTHVFPPSTTNSFEEASIQNRVIVEPDLMTTIHELERKEKNVFDEKKSFEDSRHLDGGNLERVYELFSINHDIVRPTETKTATKEFLLDPNEVNNHTPEEKTEQIVNTKQVLRELEALRKFLNNSEENVNPDPENEVANDVETYIKHKIDPAETVQLLTNNDFDIVPAESKQLENENSAYVDSLSTLILMISCTLLSMFVLTVTAIMCYRRIQIKGYILKPPARNSSQSSYIISSTFDVMDLKKNEGNQV